MKLSALILAIIVAATSAPAVPAETTEPFVTTTSMQIYGDEDDGTPRDDQAEVVVDGPESVKIGDLIYIDLSSSLGSGFAYEVEPMPPGLRTFDNGQVIVCGTGNKNVTFTFSISCALDGDSDVVIHKVKVSGAKAPGPPANPGDNLVQKVQDWVSEVDSPEQRDDAIKLAQSFASMAVIIEQGTFSTPTQLIQATATSNRDALKDNLVYWAPLLDNLMNELKAMAAVGKLPTTEAHGRVWNEVAQGLREYAETL